MATEEKFRQTLLDLITGAGEKGLRKNDLLFLLSHVDMKRLERALNQMKKAGVITTCAGGRRFVATRLMVKAAEAKTVRETAPSQPPATPKAEDGQVRGILHMAAGGFGFVNVEGGEDVFIPPDNLLNAIDGDEVMAEITEIEPSRGPSGRVTEILTRSRQSFTGCLWRGGRGGEWLVMPLSRTLPKAIALMQAPPAETTNGTWAQFNLMPPQPGTAPLASFVRSFGRHGEVEACLDAVASEYELPPPYSAAQERACYRLRPEVVPREDMTAEPTVTIDPVDARDYDDALSCRESRPGHLLVGVHIADVACYVKRQGTLAKEASRRGFTSYLPGRTLPMLPRAIANDLCSLKADEDRLAHTVFIEIDLSTGEITACRRCHTLIRSNARLCYEQVASFLQGNAKAIPDDIHGLIRQLETAARALQRRRHRLERPLPMEMPEIRPVCGGEPLAVLGLKREESDFSHELVEEFMLAANECVARELRERNLPGLFRLHPAPACDSMQEFAVSAGQVLGRKTPKIRDRADLVAFLGKLKEPETREFLSFLLLRHLARAVYGSQPGVHYGLGKEDYCHFTSPIRRYPDLVVHQQLLACDLGTRPLSLTQIQEIAGETTALEEKTNQAAFAAGDRLKVQYLHDLDKRQFNFSVEGVIVKMLKSGISVFLPDFGLMGFIPSHALGRASRFDGAQMEWTLRRPARTLRLRDRLTLSLIAADAVRGEILLKIL